MWMQLTARSLSGGDSTGPLWVNLDHIATIRFLERLPKPEFPLGLDPALVGKPAAVLRVGTQTVVTVTPQEIEQLKRYLSAVPGQSGR